MIIWIICIVECVILLLTWIIHISMKKRQKRRTVQAIQKIMRNNKLENNIRNRRAQEETYQLGKNYLSVEFLKTSPKIVWAFDPSVPITIGRGKPNVIQLRNQLVSKDHCCIFESAGVLYLKNVGAANPMYIRRGIFRKKIWLNSGGCEILEEGDVVVIAEFQLKIHVIGGRDAFVY